MRVILFALCSLGSFFLAAQTTPTTLHLDRPFHVAGEVSWFAAYAPQPAPPKVRCTIYGPDGKAMDYFFLETDANGRTNGYYRWPFELTTGYYRLALEALTATGAVASLGVFEHPVYADKRVEAGASTGAGNGRLPEANGLTASITNGQLSLSGLRGEAYSVSVVNADVVGETTDVFRTATGSTASWRDTLFFPIAVQDKEGQAFPTNLLPVFDPTTYTFGYSRADANGRGIVELGPFSGTKTIQPRALDRVDIVPSLTTTNLPALTRQPPMTDAVAAYIDLSRRRRKIYQLYATVETEVDGTLLPQERVAVEPNRDFNVQDYKVFADMYNFFKEVGGELRVRVKKENYRAQLYNAPNQRFFERGPLYIVDGKLTYDNNYVNKMSPKGVSYLAYYYVKGYLRRRFSVLAANGVVQIETLRSPSDFPAADAEDILTIKGLQPASTFLARDANADEVPALSPLLYWGTGEGTETATISLPATDDFGSYRVVVFSRAADGSTRATTASFEIPAR
ncbi:MAG: hypothetical protein AAFN92_05680 [Bacteroidota bacterium]